MVEIDSSMLIGFLLLFLCNETVEEKLNLDKEEARVPDIPSKLKLEANLSTISISWSPPIDSSVPIKGYIIGWGNPVPYDFTKTLNANQTFYQLTGLSPTTEYVVSVRAFNDHGDGPPKYETIWTRARSTLTPTPKITLLPPIGLRVDVPSPTSVVLHWTDTTLNSRNPTDDRMYTVRYSSSFLSDNPKYRYINTSRTSLLIEDLTELTQYEFAVKVIKGQSETTWSMSAINPLPNTEPNQEQTEGIVSNLPPFRSMIFLISSISAAVLLLVIAVSILFIKSRRSHGPRHDHDGRKHNGYIAAATSPVGGKYKSNIELKPPDLWIHHNDQMEVFW